MYTFKNREKITDKSLGKQNLLYRLREIYFKYNGNMKGIKFYFKTVFHFSASVAIEKQIVVHMHIWRQTQRSRQ